MPVVVVRGAPQGEEEQVYVLGITYYVKPNTTAVP